MKKTLLAATSVLALSLGSTTAHADGFGQAVAIGTALHGTQPIAYMGIVTPQQLPAMTTWTIEGWIWNQHSSFTTGANAVWGVLTEDPRLPAGYPSSQALTAGLNFRIGRPPLDTRFTWPGGECTVPGGPGGLPDATYTGRPPAHIALTYDGTTVRGFINGQLVCSADSDGAVIDPHQAGFVDQSALVTTTLDEFRISSTARYTDTFQPPSAHFDPDSDTVLLWHMDDYATGNVVQVHVNWNSPADRVTDLVVDATANGLNGDLITKGVGFIPFQSADYTIDSIDSPI